MPENIAYLADTPALPDLGKPDLDPLAFWKAKSFWYLVSAVGLQLVRAFAPETLALPGEAEMGEVLFNIASIWATLMAMRERINPSRRLVIAEPTPATPGLTPGV